MPLFFTDKKNYIIEKALRLMLTVVGTYMLNVCVCKSNKAADRIYLTAHIKK